MHNIFVGDDGFPLPLTFLGPRRHTERAREFRRGIDVERTEKGNGVIVIRIDSNPGKLFEGKEDEKVLNVAQEDLV